MGVLGVQSPLLPTDPSVVSGPLSDLGPAIRQLSESQGSGPHPGPLPGETVGPGGSFLLHPPRQQAGCPREDRFTLNQKELGL